MFRSTLGTVPFFSTSPLPSGDLDVADTEVSISLQDIGNVASITGLVIALRAYYLYTRHVGDGRSGSDEALLTEI